MRIEALRLERYGAFEQRTVDLAGPGLIVVHGPNEAGKSTCLSAIGDFLFGIPHNSPLGVFGYDAMRVGATLRTAGGGVLVLQRRKGRGKTLIDEAGVGHDDGVLAGLLGSTDRERFSQLFGLDHHGLRVGGERLLAADGEIGRLIVEAGGGLRHLMSRLDELDAEADKLFDSRKRADRAFYQGLDAFADAESRLREASLSRETYEAMRKAQDLAMARLDALRSERKDGVTQASRLERLIRVAPLLGQLRPVEDELVSFADLAASPEGLHDRWGAARRSLLVAEEAAEQAREAMARLSGRIDQLVVDSRVTAAELELKDLGERVVLIAQQRRDRPNRQRELADEEAKLAQLRERLKAADAKALAARLPPEEAVEAVQRLALEAISRDGRRQQAEQRLDEAQDAVATLTQAIESAVAAGHDRPWGLETGAFSSLAAQAAAVGARARQLEAARARLGRDVEGLGFADVAALAALPCPNAAAIQAEAVAREQIEGERTRQVAALAAARATAEGAAAEIERLRQGGAVATGEALIDARGARAAAWAPIRDAYLAWVKRPDDTRTRDVDHMSAALAAADDLADRRATEAQRIAALIAAEQRHAEARAAAAAAETAQENLAADLAARRAAFEAAFPAATAGHPELAALSAFVAARSDLLDQAGDLDQQGQDVERQQGELQPVLDQLAIAESLAALTVAGDAPLAARIQAVVAAITAQARNLADLSRRREEFERAETSFRTQSRALAALRAEGEAWSAAWAAPLSQLGATPDTAPEAAAALANQWASARGVLGSIAQTRRRLERMDEDEAALKALVGHLARELGVEVPADGLEAAAVLIAHGRAQEAVRADRAALSPELAQLQARLESVEQDLNAARAAMAGVARDAGLAAAAVDQLEATALRTRRRDELAEERRRLLDQIGTAGDGQDLVELRAQQDGRDADALKGELAALNSRLAEVDGQREAAIQEAEAARLQLAAYESGDAANRALADRESATARMHAAVERYVEVRLARELVAAAIARVRSTQQDPLVRRAGELFSAMTQGRFSGVETDVDDKGAPVVVGRRTGGGTAPVSALSDGSRDQLFLAFRLASLEVYCGATEPLPFVADDILVHFDDPRSTATLELLADFATTTQVLLFTHHESVRDAAGRMGNGRATVVELANSG